LATFDIPRFLWGDEKREERFEVIGYDFRDNLIDNIAKGNRPELLQSAWLSNFRNKGDEGCIERRE